MKTTKDLKKTESNDDLRREDDRNMKTTDELIDKLQGMSGLLQASLTHGGTVSMADVGLRAEASELSLWANEQPKEIQDTLISFSNGLKKILSEKEKIEEKKKDEIILSTKIRESKSEEELEAPPNELQDLADEYVMFQALLKVFRSKNANNSFFDMELSEFPRLNIEDKITYLRKMHLQLEREQEKIKYGEEFLGYKENMVLSVYLQKEGPGSYEQAKASPPDSEEGKKYAERVRIATKYIDDEYYFTLKRIARILNGYEKKFHGEYQEASADALAASSPSTLVENFEYALFQFLRNPEENKGVFKLFLETHPKIKDYLKLNISRLDEINRQYQAYLSPKEVKEPKEIGLQALNKMEEKINKMATDLYNFANLLPTMQAQRKKVGLDPEGVVKQYQSLFETYQIALENYTKGVMEWLKKNNYWTSVDEQSYKQFHAFPNKEILRIYIKDRFTFTKKYMEDHKLKEASATLSKPKLKRKPSPIITQGLRDFKIDIVNIENEVSAIVKEAQQLNNAGLALSEIDRIKSMMGLTKEDEVFQVKGERIQIGKAGPVDRTSGKPIIEIVWKNIPDLYKAAKHRQETFKP